MVEYWLTAVLTNSDLLRYNLHTVKFIPSNCKVWVCDNGIWSCLSAPPQWESRCPQSSLITLLWSVPSLPPHLFLTADLFSVYSFASSRMFYKWNNAACHIRFLLFSVIVLSFSHAVVSAVNSVFNFSYFSVSYFLSLIRILTFTNQVIPNFQIKSQMIDLNS